MIGEILKPLHSHCVLVSAIVLTYGVGGVFFVGTRTTTEVVPFLG